MLRVMHTAVPVLFRLYLMNDITVIGIKPVSPQETWKVGKFTNIDLSVVRSNCWEIRRVVSRQDVSTKKRASASRFWFRSERKSWQRNSCHHWSNNCVCVRRGTRKVVCKSCHAEDFWFWWLVDGCCYVSPSLFYDLISYWQCWGSAPRQSTPAS